jgi:hypothetical protein
MNKIKDKEGRGKVIKNFKRERKKDSEKEEKIENVRINITM